MFYTVPMQIFEDYKNQSYKKKISSTDKTRITQLNELALIPYLFSKRYNCSISKFCVASTNLLLNWVGLDLHHRKVNMIKDSFDRLSVYDWFESDYNSDMDKNSIINIKNSYDNDARFIVIGYDELDLIFNKIKSSGNLDLLNVFSVIRYGCHVTFNYKGEGKDRVVVGISFSESNINYKQIQVYTGIKKDAVIKKAIDELVDCGVMDIKVGKKDGYKYHTYYFKNIGGKINVAKKRKNLP